MCVTCGCGNSAHDHGHPHNHDHNHDHGHDHEHRHSHAPGITPTRMVQIERDIMAKNDAYAAENRGVFAARGILALNLLSSPGSGKTTLLVRTIEVLADRAEVAVIEGDQATSSDADRIRATGARARQINTGKGCHLDAHMVGHALEDLEPGAGSIVFIENVGNLVCPAAFDLGEAAKVVVFSVTEGEDKPIKYPDMFGVADLVLLNKTDLLPHLDFDMPKAMAALRAVNHRVKVLPVSARSGEGMEAWIGWLLATRDRERIGAPVAAPMPAAARVG